MTVEKVGLDKAELKEKVRDIWSSALGMPIEDGTDYFEVGGHSFLAMQIITRIRTECASSDVRVPLRALFDNPRFGEFVDVVATEIDARR